MKVYHNEFDKQCCEVLRRRFPDSFVDERSIEDVKPEEIEGYGQCHFFAGIGGFSLAFERKYPDGNVWTGGFPCQDLSVAGKRKGLAGKRSGLYFEFHRLIVSRLPGWVVLENVPGLLSSNEGNDFALVIGGLTGIVPEVPGDGWGNAGFFRGPVYSVAYRVLDAQFYGVPQRRRRVFIVASLGNGSCVEVLFEREGVSGNSEPCKKAWKGSSETFTIRSGKEGGGKGYLGNDDGAFPVGPQTQFVNTFQTGSNGNPAKESDTLDTLDTLASFAILAHGQANAEIVSDGSPSLTINHEAPILFDARHFENTGSNSQTLQSRTGRSLNDTPLLFQRGNPTQPAIVSGFMGGQGSSAGEIGFKEDISPTLKSSSSGTNQAPNVLWEISHADEVVRESGDISPTLQQRMGTGGNQVPMVGVRRLTPTECARLQGFPDDWNDWISDSGRYRQFGNAIAVPAGEWIAERIRMTDERNKRTASKI